MCLASRCQATGAMSDIEASGSLGDGLKVLGGAFRHSLEWSRSIALLIIRPSACIYLGFNCGLFAARCSPPTFFPPWS